DSGPGKAGSGVLRMLPRGHGAPSVRRGRTSLRLIESVPGCKALLPQDLAPYVRFLPTTVGEHASLGLFTTIAVGRRSRLEDGEAVCSAESQTGSREDRRSSESESVAGRPSG